MAYEVTATRKRPQDFEHLIGQEFVVSTLKNAIQSDRVAHAYLFAGPRGVGKTSAARILAKALNCPPGLEGEDRFAWAGAEDIAKGRSIDVIEIDGASNTSVNDIRTIKDEVLFPPQNSRYKIYIIDEVHMLSNSAFNALLKTIEEPPPYIIFIFATTELHKVPATIRSRCQQFMFKLIQPEIICDRLVEASVELGVKADKEALFWIAKESTGSMRDAYTLFDQVVAFSEGHIRLELIREKLGLVGLEQITEMATHCLNNQTGSALQLFHQVLSSGVSVEQFLIDITEYYRGLLFIQNGVDRESLLGYAKERFLVKAISEYSRSQLEKIVGILLQTYRDLRFSIDPRFELEVALSRICRMKSYIEPNELIEQFRHLEAKFRVSPLANENMTVSPKSENPPEVQPVVTKSDAVIKQSTFLDNERKQALIQMIRKSKLSLATLLEQVLEWSMADEVLILSLDSRYAADTLQSEQTLLLNTCRELIPGLKNVLINTIEKNGVADSEPKNDARIDLIKEAFRGEIVNREDHK